MLNLQQTVDREWLEGRLHVLELAGLLDRLEALQAESGAAEDPRIAILRRAIDELPKAKGPQSRTERILRLYSQLAASPR